MCMYNTPLPWQQADNGNISNHLQYEKADKDDKLYVMDDIMIL